jgi:hypothetical protein
MVGWYIVYIERLAKAPSGKLQWILHDFIGVVNPAPDDFDEETDAYRAIGLLRDTYSVAPDKLSNTFSTKIESLVRFCEPEMKPPHDGEWFVKPEVPVIKIPNGWAVKFVGAKNATGSPDNMRVYNLICSFRMGPKDEAVQFVVQNYEVPAKQVVWEQTPSDMIVYFATNQDWSKIRDLTSRLLALY